MSIPSSEIRRRFLEFFKAHGHQVVASASLVPVGDPSLLFVNSGMVQFKDTFLGLEERPYVRAVTAQRCMRVSGKHNDFENVGPSKRHNTFFEMLGNFSFGDYFKPEAVRFSWELLVNQFGLDPQRLWFTVFKGDADISPDEEAERLWYAAGALPGHVLRFDRSDNFWQMADSGPCGPNSEIHYYQGEHPEDPGYNRPELVNGPGDTVVEVWNNVFMQFNMRKNGRLDPLPRPSVDTGMGLERISAVLQGRHDIYETDLFVPIIEHTRELLALPEGDSEDPKRKPSYHIIADHVRAITFLIGDGITPSNEGRGYVLRLVLRRAARHGQLLGFTTPFLDRVIPVVIELMGEVYPEIVQRRETILRITRLEEERFLQTLRQGTQILDQAVGGLKSRGALVIPGTLAFQLHDTYGFPLDLTREVAREQNLLLDEEGFRAAMEEQSERSRSASVMGAVDDTRLRTYRQVLDRFKAGGALPPAGVQYDPYGRDKILTHIAGLLREDEPVSEVAVGDSVQVALAETCFYVEGGGQVSDTGRLYSPPDPERDGSADEKSEWEIEIVDTRRPLAGLVLHSGRVVRGSPAVGSPALAQVDSARRLAIMRNHTATHLLHAHLRRVLGLHVQQAGSLVAPDRLRFDFTHSAPISQKELRQLESGVNGDILADYPVEPYYLPYREAIGRGAMALFSEKYGDTVRMMEIDGVSRELCGGTHVASTGLIGVFHIVSEFSIGSGVRRIEAVTGHAAVEKLLADSAMLVRLGASLSSGAEQVEPRLMGLLQRTAELEKEVERLAIHAARSEAAESLKQVKLVNGVQLLATRARVANSDLLRDLADYFRERLGSGIVVLGADIQGKPSFVAAVTPDLVKQGYHAGEIVRRVAQVVGGGGGGRPTLAQAGGKDLALLDEALSRVPELIRPKNGN